MRTARIGRKRADGLRRSIPLSVAVGVALLACGGQVASDSSGSTSSTDGLLLRYEYVHCWSGAFSCEDPVQRARYATTWELSDDCRVRGYFPNGNKLDEVIPSLECDDIVRFLLSPDMAKGMFDNSLCSARDSLEPYVERINLHLPGGELDRQIWGCNAEPFLTLHRKLGSDVAIVLTNHRFN